MSEQRTELNNEIRKLAAMILPGLLASGHYTVQREECDRDDFQFLLRDNGEDWKEYVDQRFTVAAIEDAIALAERLIQETQSL